MPIGAAFLRFFAALLLSIPLFVAFGFYLGAASADQTLLDAEFITDSFQRVNLYERIYSEVFLRQEFEDWTGDLAGGFEVSGNEKAELLRNAVPPTYIEAETERNVSEALEFLRGEDDELNVFIHLDTPLENSRATALAFLDQRIDALEPVPVAGPQELSREIAVFLTSIDKGRVPFRIPSDEGLGPQQRVRGYQQAVELLTQDDAVSPAALANLQKQEPEILEILRAGSLREGLKLAGRGVAEPHVDAGIFSIRQRSDARGRLDLVEQLAESGDRTPDQVLRDARILRFLVGIATGEIAQWVALAIAVLCILAMAALFVPYWKQVIFWPSITLLIGGSLLLLVAFSAVLDSAFLTSAVCTGADPESCGLVLDIGRDMAVGVAALFADTALKIIVVGAAGVLLAHGVSRFLGRKAV